MALAAEGEVMPKFQVLVSECVEYAVIVEADDESEAKLLADQELVHAGEVEKLQLETGKWRRVVWSATRQ
ncbi:hypothetical protein ABZ348_31125 [Streptomyces sp. NPDC005963]|uniref:hypothetical protein n=1 Tax=Streptomyces sp. NPDC005963 TaxID=3156721 RepID=UPI0033E86DB4